MKYFKLFFTTTVVIAFFCGCSSIIELKEVRRGKREDSFVKVAKKFNNLSDLTLNHLNTNELYSTFKSNPDIIIEMLTNRFKQYRERATLEKLANICNYLGHRASNDDDAIKYFTTSTIFSYYYLFHDDLYPPKSSFSNPSELLISRYYNTGVTRIYEYLKKKGMLGMDSFLLPTAIADMRLYFNAPYAELSFPKRFYGEFIPVANYEVKNALSISESFGVGTPVIAILKEGMNTRANYIPDELPSPVTLFLRLEKKDNRVEARFEYYDAYRCEEVEVNGKKYPLELDFTTPMAYMLKQPELLDGITALLNPGVFHTGNGLYMLTPFSKDRIPVLFVHGLMSNPRTWSQMLNTLMDSEPIRRNYQFLMFGYPTGNPIIYSAYNLRDQLTNFRKKFDPQLANPKFNNMIVIAHSMGGLISKTLIQNSNDLIQQELFGDDWNEICAKLDDEQLETLNNLIHYEALPFIKRIVFMAVPHRGSDIATFSFANFFASMITLPQDVAQTSYAVTKLLLSDINLFKDKKEIRKNTGIGDLDPKNRSLKVINSIPFVEGIPYHSIIGNKYEAGIPGGTDGIVEYHSSHLNGATSELIVKSRHSVQMNTAAIDEVRRILLEHLNENGLLDGYGFKKEINKK